MLMVFHEGFERETWDIPSGNGLLLKVTMFDR